MPKIRIPPVAVAIEAVPLPYQLFAFWVGAAGALVAGDPAFVTNLLDAVLPAQAAAALVGVATALPGRAYAGLALVASVPTVVRNLPDVGRRALFAALMALLFE